MCPLVCPCVALVTSDACLLRLQASVSTGFDGAGHVVKWGDHRDVFEFTPLRPGQGDTDGDGESDPTSLERSHKYVM